MLQRASAVLATPVPPDALKQLLRGGWMWSRLLAAFEHYRPTSASHNQIFRGQVLMRSTRRSSASSVVQLARLVWTDVILFVLRDSSHPWRVRLRSWRRNVVPRKP
jgi:hypothetical protein